MQIEIEQTRRRYQPKKTAKALDRQKEYSSDSSRTTDTDTPESDPSSQKTTKKTENLTKTVKNVPKPKFKITY